MPAFLLFALLGLWVSCSDDNLPKVSSLDRLRIIAIETDLPEINQAGGNVTVSPWISDPQGGSRTLDLYWAQCPDPGIAYGAEPRCVGATETLIPAITLTSQDRTEELNNLFTVTVPPGLTSGRTSKDQFNGVQYLVTLRVVAGSEEIRAYKRIRVSHKSGADLNTNPSITAILFNGALPAFPNDGDKTTVSLSSGAEAYEYIDGDGNLINLTEEITLYLFVTSGDFKPSIIQPGESSTLNLEDNPSQLTIVAVVRDQRGGIAVRKEEF